MTDRCTFAYPKCWHRVWDQGCTCRVEPKRCPCCGQQLAKDKKNDRPLPAHIAGLREAAKIVQERRDGRYKDAHARVSLDEAADAILARAAELETPHADL
jgi:hypothetical protein